MAISFLKKYGIYVLIGLLVVLGLSFLKFRNPTLDDDLYVFETSIMAEAIQSGDWIGYYAGGIHGFLFKYPVALIFLITGPSLLIATVWNIFLGCGMVYLFYISLKKYFRDSLIPLAGAFLLVTNFQFMLNFPTYMREFPVILSVIFLMYLLIYKKSYWLIGLAMLLILDAKESVFFMVAPGLFLYVFFSSWVGWKWGSIWETLKKSFKIFLPPILYILIMVFTSIIPLNPVIFTVIPGVSEGGVEFQLKHFDSAYATQNMLALKDASAPTVGQMLPMFEGRFFGYLGKFLYPRSFSFLSIPKMLFFPALLTSIFLFMKARRRKDEIYQAFAMIMWFSVSIFILRQSHDRYLFPIIAVILFFFLLFLKEMVKNKKLFFWIVGISSFFALAGLLFDTEYVLIKLVLNLIIIAGYVLYYFFHERIKHSLLILSAVIGALTFSVIAYFFYANGQLRQYIVWGREYQVREVIAHFDEGEVIMLNDIGWDLLAPTYRGDRYYAPEWYWPLKEWVPRKSSLKAFYNFTTHPMLGEDIEEDRLAVEVHGIERIGLTVSNLEEYELPHQEKLDDYLNADWLYLEREVHLKNKTLFVLKVLE
jgi:hypothetical protein